MIQRGFIAPSLDEDSRAWWEALAERRLLLPHCPSCGRTWFPPTPGCPYCGSTSVELLESCGRGYVYSWVIVNRALSPAFAADVPYTILAVDLEEGARIFGRLVGERRGELTAGAEVHAEFYEVEGQVLVGFAL
jgi:uncharacterized OB-fold protein